MNNIINVLKAISKIVLCKNVSSHCCTYGPDCEFQHRNNIEMKSNQQPNGNIHLTLQTEQAIQKYKIQTACIPAR